MDQSIAFPFLSLLCLSLAWLPGPGPGPDFLSRPICGRGYEPTILMARVDLYLKKNQSMLAFAVSERWESC